MLLHVIEQGTTVPKAFPTGMALKTIWIWVHRLFMLSEISSGFEGLYTHATLQGFDYNTTTLFVPAQSSWMCKLLVTLGTCIFFLTGVCCHMTIKISLVDKLLYTNWAQMCSYHGAVSCGFAGHPLSEIHCRQTGFVCALCLVVCQVQSCPGMISGILSTCGQSVHAWI